MSDRFREELRQEVPAWVDEGLITDQQAQAILERHTAAGPPDGERTEWISTLLYGTAAVLLGAAAIAFIFVGIDPSVKPPYLLGIGLTLAAAGVVLDRVNPERDLLADALLAAGLAPLAAGPLEASATNGGALGYGLPAMALPAAYLVWRRDQPFLPTLSVVGFTVAAWATGYDPLPPEGAHPPIVWLTMQGLLLVALVALDRVWRDRDAAAPVALGVLALAGSLIPFLVETVEISSSETVGLVLGGALLAVLGAGVALRHRGLVYGASIGLAVDAMVFAFDVGGVWLGTGLLVALAVALIWQAELLKRWVVEAP